jgi:hypothetical protein
MIYSWSAKKPLLTALTRRSTKASKVRALRRAHERDNANRFVGRFAGYVDYTYAGDSRGGGIPWLLASARTAARGRDSCARCRRWRILGCATLPSQIGFLKAGASSLTLRSVYFPDGAFLKDAPFPAEILGDVL